VSISERRQREVAQREQLIITTARELAESEGWDAVTTRRLAERIEYSQPVLYSHFAGKDAIVDAVALVGFAELLDALRIAAGQACSAEAALDRVAGAYLDFAAGNGAVYQAMFTLATTLPFATEQAPPQLKGGFGELRGVLAALHEGCEGCDHDIDVLTEVFWSTLHGMAVLLANGRIPARLQDQRRAILVELFGGAARPGTSAVRGPRQR
jgi:AcrR family transcriptional regulator